MKNKKLIIGSLVAAMLAPISLCFTGCKEEKNPLDINAKDVYAMCAATSAEYLKDIVGEPQSVSKVVPVDSSTRPTLVQDEDIVGIKNSLSMFDQIIQSGISQNTQNNTSNVIGFKDYTFSMEITFPDLHGAKTYTMYYNEVKTETEEEVEDAEVEVEVSTHIDGLLVVDGEHYLVKGEREFEREGNEEESSIEFTTYLDNQNFITFEQSVEDGEIEYEYSIYQDGQKIQETEFEIEKTRRGYEVEFQQTAGTQAQTEYKIYVGESSNIVVVLRKNKAKEVINVEELDGEYRFTYSNGFSETV